MIIFICSYIGKVFKGIVAQSDLAGATKAEMSQIKSPIVNQMPCWVSTLPGTAHFLQTLDGHQKSCKRIAHGHHVGNSCARQAATKGLAFLPLF